MRWMLCQLRERIQRLPVIDVRDQTAGLVLPCLFAQIAGNRLGKGGNFLIKTMKRFVELSGGEGES